MVENKDLKQEKTPNKEDKKLKELKIEFLKTGAKKKGIKKEIARILTKEKTMKGENNK